MAHSKEKNNSADSVPNRDSMAAILDKDCKTAALKLLKELKEDVEKIMKTICEQNGDINKEIESPKRNQKEILELKGTVIEMKISLQGFKGRFEWRKERISEFDDRKMEIIKPEEQKGRRWKKRKQTDPKGPL